MFFNKKTNEDNHFKNYTKNKDYLCETFEKVREQIKFLDIKQLDEELLINLNKVKRDSFKILIVGSFKNGKSTFINYLLGKEILPAYSTPCTAVINEIKYDEIPKAVIHFKTGIKLFEKKYLLKLPSFIQEHIKKYSETDVPPIEIPYEELEDYVVIPVETENQEEGIQESPYEKVELFYPLDLLKNGIEIIDSPGINESSTHTRIAQNYVKNADAIIFVFNSLALFSKAEDDFIEQEIIGRGFKEIICIINRIDQVRNDAERERIKQFSEKKIVPLTSLGESGVFYGSAYDALNGKLNNNKKLLLQSGFNDFEQYLANYLVNKKGIIKLTQPTFELKRIISDSILKDELPLQTNLIDKSIQELLNRQKEIEPEISSLKLRRDDIERKLISGMSVVKNNLRECVEQYYNEIDTKLEIAINEYTPSEKISLFQAKKQAELIGVELCNYLQQVIENEQKTWAESSFQPLFSEQLTTWLNIVERNLNDFYLQIDAVKITTEDVIVQGNGVPLWQRALGVGLGAVFGLWDIALMGGIGGLNTGMFASLGLELAGAFALSLVGLLNPVTMIGMAILAVLHNGFTVGERIEKQMKQKVLKQVIDSIHSHQQEVIDSLIDSCENEMKKIEKSILDNMNGEIETIKTRLDNVIKEKEQGELNAIEYKKQIANCDSALKSVLTDLDAFISKLQII